VPAGRAPLNAIAAWPRRTSCSSGAAGLRLRRSTATSPFATTAQTLLRDARAAGAGATPLLAADVVDQDVLTQPVRRHEKRAALVDPRHLVDELGQVRPALEHERVDHDA